MSDRDVVIRVEKLSKKFNSNLMQSIRYGITDIARNAVGLAAHSSALRPGEFWALDDISFEVRRGEAVGIIGPNGAGKSTLLKLLNGIVALDRGKIEINGRVGTLIEVGAGFHPMLTGRENIYVNGAILGMTRRETDRKLDSIIEFADIGEFIDMLVKFYSSGMYTRLGFSVAAHLDPQILLIDEVLSVGDISFKAKCYGRMKELKERGITIMFVSHSMELVSRICGRTIYLNRGKIQTIGETEKAVSMYERDSQYGANAGEDTVLKSTDVVIRAVRVCDEDGKEKSVIKLGECLVVEIVFSAERRVNTPNFYVGIYNAEGIYCMWLRNDVDGFNIPYIEGNGRTSIEFPEFELAPGVYWINAQIFDSDFTVPLSINKRACRFEILADNRVTGIYYPKRNWNLQISENS